MKEIKFANISFLDFRNIFMGSLETLAINWKVPVKKTKFDYSKVKYEEINHTTPYKDEAIEYCMNDCEVLKALHNKYMDILEEVKLPRKKKFFSVT